VLNNENNLVLILEKVAAEGTVRLQDEVANKPQPPEIADEVKKKIFFSKLNKTAIESRVEELKKLKLNEIE
jgi:hypothetical protein